MVINDPAVASTRLLSLGSKLRNYILATCRALLINDLTRFMQNHSGSEQAQIEQVKERFCWQGVRLIARMSNNNAVAPSRLREHFCLKPCAKRSQNCWMLRVASVCTPCCMLLRLVGSCCAKFETGQTFSYVQTDATTPNIVGSCRPTILRLLARGFKSLINEICKFLHRICFTVSLLIPQGHIPLKCNKLPRHLNDENLPQDQEQRRKGLRFFCRESGFRRKRCQASLQVVSIRLHLKWN